MSTRSTGGGRLTASFRIVGTALGNRRLRAVLTGFSLFSAAEWIRWVGLLVYGFAEAGPLGSGLVVVVQLVPAAAITPFISSLADRYLRDRVLAAAYLVAGLGTTGAGIAIAAGAPFPLAAALAAIGMCGVTMVRPTQASLMPQLAETPGELTAANVSGSLVTGASLFVGPAIASGVLVLSGATAVVLTAGSMLLLGAVFVAFARRVSGPPPAVDERVELLGGFRELGRNPGAARIVALLGLHAATWGMVDIVIVSLAVDELGLGTSGVGLLSASLGIGALAGGAATMALVGRDRLAPAFTFGVGLWGAPLLALGVVGVPLPALILLAAAGMGLSFLDVSGKTLLQRVVSDETLGRVFGLLEGGFMASWAVGSSVAPGALRLLGIGWTFVAAGAVVPVLTALWWRTLVQVDREVILPGPELELLRGIAMFRPLPEAVLERMARNLTEVSMPAGSSIIREGEPGDLFYVIAEGEVLVTVGGSEVARYGPGHYFGEIALLRDVPRQASVEAITDVRLFGLERTHFLDAVTGSRSAAAAANREIDRRLGTQIDP